MSALAAIAAPSGPVQGFYAEIGVELPAGAGEAKVRCFVNPEAHRHEDRIRSCAVNLVTGVWCCHGCGERGNPYAAAVARGYPQRQAVQLAKRHGLFLESVRPERAKSFKMGGWRQCRRWMDALASSPVILRRLWELKGWTPEAMRRCWLGWDARQERLTFTICAPDGMGRAKIVGVALYRPGAEPKMVSWPGSRRDLFPMPERLVKDWPLFVVEGEPDAVSVRSCGLQAVAVPGAHLWRQEWARRLSPFKNVIVMCDCDSQGRELAARVATAVPRARVVDLEPARDDGYDVGELVVEASREGGVGQARRLLEGLAA